LLTHGRAEEAEQIVSEIERKVCKYKKIRLEDLPPVTSTMTIYPQQNPIGNVSNADNLFSMMYLVADVVAKVLGILRGPWCAHTRNDQYWA
jgi:hypothetical protein